MTKKSILAAVFFILSINCFAQTEYRDDAGLRGDQGATSGFFQTSSPINYPANAGSWWHLLDVRHSNSANNYAMQFSGSFFDQNLYFRKTNNNPATQWAKVVLEKNGNVGIGTDVPANKISFQDVPADSQDGITWYNPSPTSYGIHRTGGAWNAPNYQQLRLSWDTGLILDPGTLYGKSYVDIQGSGLRVTSGSVGIGTTVPDEKLTVKGKIHAEEVKVDLAVPGPDYVFEKAYPLMPLSEIQTFINENKHLPEVPSAKEMEKTGINLSEMNMLLLKKVEELTLYIIDINHQNKKRDELVKKQEYQIFQLLKFSQIKSCKK